MVCKNPTPLAQILKRKEYEKQHWKYNPYTQEISVNDTEVPCGNCIPCKIERAKEWALRCCLELPYWDKSIFTTLTYRDEDLPEDKSLHKEVLDKFVHDLRNNTNQKIKVMGCGEYGDESFRCHYHAIIFGIGQDYNVKKQYGYSTTYESENALIERCWKYGNVFNGAVTYNSARYVASYIFKKYNGQLEEDIYTSNGYETPFQKISNGIGKQFYDEWKNEIFRKGYITFKGVKHSIPRYFFKLAEKENLFEKIGYWNKQGYTTDIAIEKYEEAYNKKQKELATKLMIQPDKFNEQLIGDYKELKRIIGSELQKEKREKDMQKANHLTYKNDIYNGEKL